MGWRLYRGWRATDKATLPALRECFEYTAQWPGRQTGWLWRLDPPPMPPVSWPEPLTAIGPRLLAALTADTGIVFTACCFQAYRNGAGQDWHHDRDWGAQAVLSLGVTRSFAVRRTGSPLEAHMRLAHGDMLFMPPGFQDEWEHCVPPEDVPGERCSLVFRSAA